MAKLAYYDIALCPPNSKYGGGVNPWKSRFALNFKKADYATTWVPVLDIAKVRKSLEVPAVRKFPDGSDYYTLPVLINESNGDKVGDSFDIAVYLEKNYPDAPSLFPDQKLDFNHNLDNVIGIPVSDRKPSEFEEYSIFNTKIDEGFQSHVGLMGGNMRFDPAVEKECKAMFLERVPGFTSWDQFQVTGEARQAMLDSFKRVLGELAKLYQRDPSGPFILGKQASYADFIVGGWLRFSYLYLPEWNELATWHEGIFGKLYEALQPWADTK